MKTKMSDAEFLKALASPTIERATLVHGRSGAGEGMRAIARTIAALEARSPGSTAAVWRWRTRRIGGVLVGVPIAAPRGRRVADCEARLTQHKLDLTAAVRRRG